MQTIWERWRRIAEKVGNLQTSIVFSILYFLLFIPVGFFSLMFQDFLGKKGLPSWKRISDNASNLVELGKQ